MKKHQGTEDGGVAEAEAVVNLRQVYKAKVVDGGREKKKKKEKEKEGKREEERMKDFSLSFPLSPSPPTLSSLSSFSLLFL